MTEYTSAEPVTLEPGESKAVKFRGNDGTERMFIVSIPATAGTITTITMVTDDGAFEAPVVVSS
jgi:hypothetical protein